MPHDSAALELHDLQSGQTLDGSESTPASAHESDTPRVSITVNAPAHIPDRIGRYLIVRELGQGGMGIVYLAYDPELDRRIAIKIVRDPYQTILVRARVQQEAQAMARVSHPNIVHVYEAGESNGLVYIAMEFVSGTALSSWQKPQSAGPRPIEQLLRIYLQAAEGLLAAHEHGLIHRDFKPDNVLVGDDGRARVLDFGLARAVQGAVPVVTPSSPRPGARSSEQRLTQVGAILGTPGYMSPEQVRGKDADARGDQWSFCAALYEALYAQLPFAGDSFEEFAAEVRAGRLRKPPKSEVPLVVEQSLLRGLSVEPSARFASMKELIAALVLGTHPDSEVPTTHKASRRLALVLGLFVVTAAALTMPNRGQPTDDSLRVPLQVFSVYLVVFLGAIIALRKTLLRRATYRRLVYFGLVLSFYTFASRLLGFTFGLPKNQYIPLEMFAVGALFALEAPRLSPRYGFVALLNYFAALLVLIRPELRAFVGNSVYPLTVILALYFPLTRPPAPPKERVD